MNKVIIINGSSCGGKATIEQEICKQTDNKFVHLQIDKAGEFYSTIFPKGFLFAENEPGTEDNDNTLLGLFNNNHLSRRKFIASVLLATAKELLSDGGEVIMNEKTIISTPDLARKLIAE